MKVSFPKYSYKKKQVYEFLNVGIGSIGSIILTFIGVKLISTELGVEAYGELAIYLTISTLFNLLISGPFSGGITRFASIAIQEKLYHHFEKDVLSIFIKCSQFTILLFSLLILGSFYFNISKATLILIYAILYCISYTAIVFILAILSAVRERTLVNAINILEKIFRFGFAILAIFLFSANPATVFFSFGIGLFTTALISIFIYFKLVRAKVTLNGSSKKTSLLYTERIWKYSQPFLIFGGIYWLQSSSERWFLDYFLGKEDVGLYSIYNQIGFQTFFLLTNILGILTVPIIFEKSAKESTKVAFLLNKKITYAILVIGVLSTYISWQYQDSLIVLFSSEEYVKKAYLLPFITIGGVLFAVGQNISMESMIMLRPKLLHYPKIISGLAGLVLNYLLIKFYGVDGLVISIISTNLLYVCVVLFIQNHFLNSNNDFEDQTV